MLKTKQQIKNLLEEITGEEAEIKDTENTKNNQLSHYFLYFPYNYRYGGVSIDFIAHYLRSI